MVFGWRKAFCTSIPKETSSGPRLFQWSSTPSSPRSPSPFSLIKSNLRISTTHALAGRLHSNGRRYNKEVFSVLVQVGGDPCLAMQNTGSSKLVDVHWEGAITMAVLFEQSSQKHSQLSFPCTRKLIDRSFISGGEGRKFEKLHLGEYQLESLEKVYEWVCSFASGLIQLGHGPDICIAIVYDTHAEWLIAFEGCFRQNITVLAIYASLGDHVLIPSPNETKVSTKSFTPSDYCVLL